MERLRGQGPRFSRRRCSSPDPFIPGRLSRACGSAAKSCFPCQDEAQCSEHFGGYGVGYEVFFFHSSFPLVVNEGCQMCCVCYKRSVCEASLRDSLPGKRLGTGSPGGCDQLRRVPQNCPPPASREASGFLCFHQLNGDVFASRAQGSPNLGPVMGVSDV